MADPGSSQSVPDPTPVAQSQAAPQSGVSDPNLSDGTNPIQSTLRVSHPLDIKCLKAQLWSRSVKSVLIAKNVYDCITHAKPGTRGNEVAMSVLLEKIPEQWADEIVSMDSAKEAFQWLENKYKGGHNHDLIDEWGTELDYGKMSSSQSINDYVVNKFKLARGLKDNQIPVSNSRLMFGVVKGLPREFEHQKAGLYTSIKDCGQDAAIHTLIQSARLLGYDETGKKVPSANALPNTSPGYMGRGRGRGSGLPPRPLGMPEDLPDGFTGCWHCRQEGHRRFQCRAYLEEQERSRLQRQMRGPQQSGPPPPVAGMAGTGAAGQASDSGIFPSRWVVDTGATSHVCNDIRLMTDVRWYPTPQPLNVATGEQASSRKACGKVVVVDVTGNQSVLSDVEYVPTALENLISVSAAVEYGFLFSVNQNGEIVRMQHKTENFQSAVMKIQGLYFVTPACFVTRKVCEAHTSHICGEYDLWHKRLGHPGSGNLERLQREGMVRGVETSLKKCEHAHDLCDVCVRGKQTKEAYPATPYQATRRLELLHMDIVGELPVEGAEGERYFLSVLDDYSRACEVRALSSKTQVPQAVKDIIQLWENQTRHTVQVVRTDRGSEFVNHDLHDFFAEKGIRHEMSAPYTPQQNGRAERLNRSVKEKIRLLLFQAQAPASMWVDALPTAVRLLNLRAVKGRTMTPYEALFGKKPSIHYLRVWGCLAYVKLPDKELTAFGPRSEAGMFVGYEPTSKAYRVRVGNKIRISKNVKFFEQELGIKTLEHPSPEAVEVSQDAVLEGSGGEEEDWDFLPVGVDQAVNMHRHVAVNDADVLPEHLEMFRRMNQMLGPPEESLSAPSMEPQPPSAADDTIVQPPLDEDESASVREDHSTQGGDHVEEDGSEPDRRGGGRYNLRPTVAEPNRYVPGAMNVRNAEVLIATPVETPGQNDAREQYKLSSRNIKVPQNYQEAMTSPQRIYWMEAMSEEMDSIDAHDTFEYLAKPDHAKIIPLIWVYALKSDEFGDVVRFKARLVAQGCKQRPGIDYFETYAPVSTHTTRRVLLNLAASEGWEVQQVDVKTAFLNGVLEEEVYVSQAPGFHNGDKNKVCRLKKSLYGLKQAPRVWHQRLSEELGNSGFDACKSDPALFINRSDVDSPIYMLVYVDDLLIMGKNASKIDNVKSSLKETFSIHDLGEVRNFLGSEIKVNKEMHTLKMTNVKKIEDLAREYGVPETGNTVETPMATGFVPTANTHTSGLGKEMLGSGVPLPEGHRYLELIGSLQFLATTTRPDIAQAIGVLSRFRGSPTTSHWNGAIRVVKYLVSTKDLGIVYGGGAKNGLVCYVDADFAGDLDSRKSTTGFVFLLNGSVVSWGSRKQSSVATSTVEAEYIAAATAIKEAVWVGRMLEELGILVGCITMYCDNQGCISNLKNHLVSKYTKHISVSYHYAREHVSWGHIEPVYISTHENVADMFTKPLAPAVFLKHRKQLGME